MKAILTGLTFFVCLIYLIRGYVIPLTPSYSNHSIIDRILNDKDICITPKPILGSFYLEKCKKLPYPEGGIIQLDRDNVDTFFCLVIYDRCHKICYTISKYFLLGTPVETLLTNETLFNAEINKKVKEYNAVKVLPLICDSLKKSSHLHLYKQTEDYVNHLINNFDCKVSCYDSKELNPLCLAIYVIDKQLIDDYKLWLSRNPDERDINENIEEVSEEMNNDLTLDTSASSSITEALITEEPGNDEKNLNANKPSGLNIQALEYENNVTQSSVDTEVLFSPSLIIITTMVIMIFVSMIGLCFIRKTGGFHYRRHGEHSWLPLFMR